MIAKALDEQRKGLEQISVGRRLVVGDPAMELLDDESDLDPGHVGVAAAMYADAKGDVAVYLTAEVDLPGH